MSSCAMQSLSGPHVSRGTLLRMTGNRPQSTRVGYEFMDFLVPRVPVRHHSLLCA